MTELEAKQHEQDDGWAIAEDAGRGWRRLVPSPKPLDIIELSAIRTLIDSGALVVAVGGGGIPVIYKPDGTLRPRPAVIDKDAASCLLALELGASVLIFSTDVDKATLDYGTPEQVEIDQMNLEECRQYLDARSLRRGQHAAEDRERDQVSRERRQGSHHHATASP